MKELCTHCPSYPQPAPCRSHSGGARASNHNRIATRSLCLMKALLSPSLFCLEAHICAQLTPMNFAEVFFVLPKQKRGCGRRCGVRVPHMLVMVDVDRCPDVSGNGSGKVRSSTPFYSSAYTPVTVITVSMTSTLLHLRPSSIPQLQSPGMYNYF